MPSRKGDQYIEPMRSAWLPPWIAAPPSRCAVCGAWPARPLCAGCLVRFGAPRNRCQRCALPLPQGVSLCGGCLREPPPLDRCFAAVDYAFPWSGLVGRFKFQGEPGWAATLARRMAGIPGFAEELAQVDLVLPMPLARGRLAERGFNQAWLLARRLAGAKADPLLLLRLRETASQTSLDRADRRRNVEGAFGLEPLRADAVRGRRVLLVDDVMTSGASLHAAAGVLRQAGAARVGAVVLARTDQPA
jgi:ComF family protein